jgi:uncharacterized protein YcbX
MVTMLKAIGLYVYPIKSSLPIADVEKAVSMQPHFTRQPVFVTVSTIHHGTAREGPANFSKEMLEH